MESIDPFGIYYTLEIKFSYICSLVYLSPVNHQHPRFMIPSRDAGLRIFEPLLF